jgi:hypothetical protein
MKAAKLRSVENIDGATSTAVQAAGALIGGAIGRLAVSALSISSIVVQSRAILNSRSVYRRSWGRLLHSFDLAPGLPAASRPSRIAAPRTLIMGFVAGPDDERISIRCSAGRLWREPRPPAVSFA